MGEHKVRLKDVLRSKNFLILVLFIVATSISIWLLNLPTPNLRSIMSETHKQIESQIKNFKNMKQDMMMNEQNEDRELTLDQTYLELLGKCFVCVIYIHVKTKFPYNCSVNALIM